MIEPGSLPTYEESQHFAPVEPEVAAAIADYVANLSDADAAAITGSSMSSQSAPTEVTVSSSRG